MQETPALRDYSSAPPEVIEFYRMQHSTTTVTNVMELEREIFPPRKRQLTMWQAITMAKEVRDGSDPDMLAAQKVHFYGTTKAAQEKGEPLWKVLGALLHDTGKVLVPLYDLPQHQVVGDTFPVGCPFEESNILVESFKSNPDNQVAEYQRPLGMYREGCGFQEMYFAFGHDAYLAAVLKQHISRSAGKISGLTTEETEALIYVIQFHSFYPWHQQGGYSRFASDYDKKMLPHLKSFQLLDLYSKPKYTEEEANEGLEREFRPLVESAFGNQLIWF